MSNEENALDKILNEIKSKMQVEIGPFYIGDSSNLGQLLHALATEIARNREEIEEMRLKMLLRQARR